MGMTDSALVVDVCFHDLWNKKKFIEVCSSCAMWWDWLHKNVLRNRHNIARQETGAPKKIDLIIIGTVVKTICMPARPLEYLAFWKLLFLIAVAAYPMVVPIICTHSSRYFLEYYHIPVSWPRQQVTIKHCWGYAYSCCACPACRISKNGVFIEWWPKQDLLGDVLKSLWSYPPELIWCCKRWGQNAWHEPRCSL